MDMFMKAKVVKLRSHHDKYLVAEDDEEGVCQDRDGSIHAARWTVELIDEVSNAIRLKSFCGRYLTASNIPFLLGVTGRKVLQTIPRRLDSSVEWEPYREGIQVKLRTRYGNFLRANGGLPPWRNSVTHDVPHRTATQDWVLWDLDVIEVLPAQMDRIFSKELLLIVSLFSILPSPVSPYIAVGAQSEPFVPPRISMDMFRMVKVVKLRSEHGKYLVADDDEEGVRQDRDGSVRASRWVVQRIDEGSNAIRLKSICGRYLTASNIPFLLGVSGRKVLQTSPRHLNSSAEWEPHREGDKVKLRTPYGNFLRANGCMPPWRNSVTHDVPYRSATQNWILWDLEVIEFHPATIDRSVHVKSIESLPDSPPMDEGRTISYHIADDRGNVNEDAEANTFIFKGLYVEELAKTLKEETGLDDIIICTKSPLNGKLYPLRLQLPPNNAPMTVIVVSSTSRVAQSFPS